MKKKLALLIAVLLLLVITITCVVSAEGKTTIRLQIVWAEDSGRGLAIREILDEFEQQNPGIKVKLIGGSQGEQKLLTTILSGNAPEVIQIPYRQIKALGTEGAFIDLTAKFAEKENLFYEELWKLTKAEDERIYGYPWMGHSIQLVYNKTLFAEAGLAGPPNDWEELYQHAKKLTVDKDGDGRIDQYGLALVGKQHPDITWLFTMFAHQAGAKLVKEVNGEYQVALNSTEGKKALEFYVKLVNEVCPPDTGNKDGGGVMADFRNQVAAMEFQGPWGVTDIWKNGRPFEVSAAPVPAGPAGRAADIGPYMLAITTGIKGEQLEASYQLINFLGSKKGQEMLMRGEKAQDGNYYPFRVPIRKDMATTEYFQQNPEFIAFIEGMKYPSINSPIKEWVKISAEVYRSELNKAVLGLITPEEALKNIEERGNRILAESSY